MTNCTSKIYDVFHSLSSHQHVSAAIAAIFRPNSGRNMLMGTE